MRWSAYIVLVSVGFGCKTTEGRTAESEPEPPAVEIAVDAGEVVEADAGTSDATGSEQRPEPRQPEETDDDRPRTFVPKPKLPRRLGLQEMALARAAEKYPEAGLAFKPVLTGNDCDDPDAIRAALGYGPDSAWYSIDECDRAVRAVHAKTYERFVTKFGAIDVSPVALRHNGVDLWSAVDGCRQMADEVACPSDYRDAGVTTMSLVGPILTYAVGWSEARAGGPPYHGEFLKTVDLRRGKPAAFDAIVTEESILEALKRDSYLRRHVDPERLDAAETLEDVWELWGAEHFAHFGEYYFIEWKNGQAAMRITFLESRAGLDTNQLKELGIWVTPKPKFRAAFEDAAAGEEGFLAAR